MELSLFLAQLIGLGMIISLSAMFFRPVLIERVVNDLHTSTFSLLVSGFIGIGMGLAIVLSHNIWELNWRGLITLFGWLSLIKGITYMAFPDLIIKTAVKTMSPKTRNFLIIVGILGGCYLAYNGFGL